MFPAQALSRVLAAQPVLDAIERDQAAPRAAFGFLDIGQAVSGRVKSQAKEISLVEIAGQTVAMRLPHPVAVGDTLRLRFAGHMPQPVFLLEAPETADEMPQLSQTARLLSDLMQRVPERTPPTLAPPAPLLGQPAASPAQLALVLRTALVRSGLFYESHLANWAVGLDSLDGLLQEPQNRLTTDVARAALPGMRTPGESADAPPANPLLTLLSQQLQVLETPQFVWKGELWPGQSLEWRLRQETDGERPGDPPAPADDAGAAGWESHLRLTLPRLGGVDVRIRLDARQAFSIEIAPDAANTGALLHHQQARLSERLAAAGCVLDSLRVQHDANT